MFIFRFLEFVFKIVGTLFIVIFLQLPLGKQSLEEHLLSFLRGSEKVEFVKSFATDGKQVFQKKLVIYLQEQINQTRDLAQSSESEVKGEEDLMNVLTPVVEKYTRMLTSVIGKGLEKESLDSVEDKKSSSEEETSDTKEKSN